MAGTDHSNREPATTFLASAEVFDVTLADTDLAKGVLVTTAGVSARGAVHAAVMMNSDIEVIATFDRSFDRMGSIRRLELG